MSKSVFNGKYFKITHTTEPEGEHPAYPHHYEDMFAITAVIRGGGKCYIEDNVYPISDGDIVVFGLNEMHSFRFVQSGYHERISVYFSSSVLPSAWEYELPLMQTLNGRSPGMGNCLSQKEYDQTEVQAILSGICAITDSTAPEEGPMTEAKMHLLILRLLFTLYESFERRKDAITATEDNTIISEICRYICENISENLTYERIQEKFYVSRYQLSVTFKKNMGMTLTEYILQKRLMMVSSQVRRGVSITEASINAGFNSYSHFYKVFTKHHKMAPQKYYSIGK